MSEQQVVVLLAARSTDLHERGILGSIVTADSKVGLHPITELDIDACTIVPAAVVELAKVTVLVEVTDASEIGSTVSSTADIDRMLLGECRTPILVEQIITEALHGCKFIRLEKVGQTIERRILWVGCLHGIPQTTVVVGRKHLWTSHFISHAHGARVADLRSTLLTLLGGNKDDTIGSTRTIDSSCGVLQYGNRFDDTWVEVVEGSCTEVLGGITYFHIIRIDVAVDDVKRFLSRYAHISERIGVTDLDGGILAWTGITTAHTHTIDHTAEGGSEATARKVLDVVHLHRGNSTGEVCLLLYAVTNDNNVLELLGILLEDNLLGVTGHGFGNISEEHHLEGRFLGSLNHVITVDVGNGSCCGSHYLNGCANDGFSQLIHYSTLDCTVRLSHDRNGQKAANDWQKYSSDCAFHNHSKYRGSPNCLAAAMPLVGVK